MGKPEITELPTRFLVAALGSGRRWKRLVAVVIVGVLVAGVAGFFLLKNMEANQEAAVQKQWGALQGCILGEPLQPGEAASARVRAIQLTVLGMPHDQRAKTGEFGWPAYCATTASWLAEHAESTPTGGPELKTAAETLAKTMREDVNATADIGKLVDDVWKNAAAAGLSTPLTSTPSVPKPAVALLPKEALSAQSGLAGEYAVGSLKADPAPAKGLRFLIDDNALVGGAVLCTASGTPTSLACKAVSAEVAKRTPGLALEGTTDPEASPWIFAGDKGQLGIFRPAGTAALTGTPAVGSSVDKDGSAWLLLHPTTGTPADLQLVHAPLTGDVPPGRPALDPGEVDSAGDATLLWGSIIGAADRRHIPAAPRRAQAVGQGRRSARSSTSATPRPSTVERDDKLPRFSSCRSGDSTACGSTAPRATWSTFYTAGVWSAPVPLATRGGVMLCRGNEAAITQVWSVSDSDGTHATVEQARCNTSGCTQVRLSIREMLLGTDVHPQEGANFAAAEVNRKLLLVWNAGPLGGLRMRLRPPIDRMKSTPDELIVDSREASGQSDITEIRILSTADTALLFVNTTKGPRSSTSTARGRSRRSARTRRAWEPSPPASQELLPPSPLPSRARKGERETLGR